MWMSGDALRDQIMSVVKSELRPGESALGLFPAITVSDSGHGIAPAELRQAHERAGKLQQAAELAREYADRAEEAAGEAEDRAGEAEGWVCDYAGDEPWHGSRATAPRTPRPPRPPRPPVRRGSPGSPICCATCCRRAAASRLGGRRA